jgi:hypothetical protein
MRYTVYSTGRFSGVAQREWPHRPLCAVSEILATVESSNVVPCSSFDEKRQNPRLNTRSLKYYLSQEFSPSIVCVIVYGENVCISDTELKLMPG